MKNLINRWREQNRERFLEFRRKVQKRYARKYPEKVRAHKVAHKHTEELKKGFCENCQSRENLVMHHPNYFIPLEVITLCDSCHHDLHKKYYADPKKT